MNTAAARPLEAIAGFAALLRDHGLKVGIAEQQAMVGAALRVPIERAAQLDPAWRAIACHDPRDWRRWPELFERYWFPQRQKGKAQVSGQTRPSRNLQQVVQALHDDMDRGMRPKEGASAQLTQVHSIVGWSCITRSRWSRFRLTFARRHLGQDR